MGREVETEMGRCDTHGAVTGTREVPTISFPWIVNAVRRSMAKRRPFVCPECGDPIDSA